MLPLVLPYVHLGGKAREEAPELQIAELVHLAPPPREAAAAGLERALAARPRGAKARRREAQPPVRKRKEEKAKAGQDRPRQGRAGHDGG